MEHPKKVIVGSMVITIFVLVVTLSSWYVWNVIYFGDVCSCVIPLPILIPVLASIGLLVGTLVYYMFSPNFDKAPLCKEAILKLLEAGEREIISVLIDSGGRASQTSLGKSTGMSKVKVFRLLEKLVSRGIVEKESHGKTNMIMLSEDLKDLLPK